MGCGSVNPENKIFFPFVQQIACFLHKQRCKCFPPADVICSTDFVNIFHMQRSSLAVVIGSIFTWDLRMQGMAFGL